MGMFTDLLKSPDKKKKKKSDVKILTTCQNNILTSKTDPAIFSHINQDPSNLTSLQKKILTILTKCQNLTNQQLADKLKISRQRSSYNVKKLVEKGYIVKDFVKKSNVLLVGSTLPAQKQGEGRLDKWTYKVPIVSYSKSTFDTASWNTISKEMKGGVKNYVLEDMFYLSDTVRKIHNLKDRYVHFTLKFFRTKSNTPKTLLVIFNKFRYNGKFKEAKKTCYNLLCLYLRDLEKRFDLTFDFSEPSKIKKVSGQILISKLPNFDPSIQAKGDNIIIDESEGEPELETEDESKIEVYEDLPDTISSFEYQLSQILDKTNRLPKILHLQNNILDRMTEMQSILVANDKEMKIHHEFIKKKLDDDLKAMYS